MNIKISVTCLMILCLAFTLLIFFSNLNLDKPNGNIFLKTADAGSGYNEHVSSLNEFSKEASDNFFDLTYGFIDYQAKKHFVTFRMNRSDYNNSLSEYGFNDDQIYEMINKKLLDKAKQAIDNLGYSEYIQIELNGSSSRYSVSAPADISDNVFESAKEIFSDLVSNKRKMYNAELQKRGFIHEGDLIKIDYNKLVSWNKKRVANCFKSLYQSGKEYDLKKFLGLVLAFTQEITYEVPPTEADGKNISGLYVPPEVLVNNHGDCDSKSVTFCSIWKYVSNSSAVILEVPNHVLVGVEMTPGAGQSSVTIGSKKYVICEVAGPGKLYPGSTGDSYYGSFSYVMIN